MSSADFFILAGKAQHIFLQKYKTNLRFGRQSLPYLQFAFTVFTPKIEQVQFVAFFAMSETAVWMTNNVDLDQMRSLIWVSVLSVRIHVQWVNVAFHIYKHTCAYKKWTPDKQYLHMNMSYFFYGWICFCLRILVRTWTFMRKLEKKNCQKKKRHISRRHFEMYLICFS